MLSFLVTMIFVTFFAIAGLLLLLAFVKVNTGQVFVIFRLGKFQDVKGPGPHLLAPIIDQGQMISTQTRQFELPDEPENIDRISDVPPPGKKAPFRIPHKGLEEAIFWVKQSYGPDEDPFDNTKTLDELKPVRFSQLPTTFREAMKADSLNAPLTSEVTVSFEWHVKADPTNDWLDVKNYVQNIEVTQGRTREEEVRKRAEDMVARVLQEHLAQTTMGHAIYMSSAFSKRIKDALEKLVGEKGTLGPDEKPWGIHVSDAFLKPLYAGRQVNDARAKAASAVSDKQTTIHQAEAKKESDMRGAEASQYATKLDADVKAYAEGKKGEGEAARLGHMGPAMEKPNAAFIAALDVVETIAPKMNAIVVPSGEGGMVASLLSLVGLNMSKGKPPEPTNQASGSPPATM